MLALGTALSNCLISLSTITAMMPSEPDAQGSHWKAFAVKTEVGVPAGPTPFACSSGSRAVSASRRWERGKQLSRQTLARRPDLHRDNRIGAGVVVDQAPFDLLANNVCGIASRKPSDVGISIVVGESCAHSFQDNSQLPLGVKAGTDHAVARCSRCAPGWDRPALDGRRSQQTAARPSAYRGPANPHRHD
jgi:hypothetical protein